MSIELYRAGSAPASTPTAIGQRYANTSQRRIYNAKNTSAAADWIDAEMGKVVDITVSTVITKDYHGKTIRVNSGSAVVLTVPQTSTEALDVDFGFHVIRWGTGTVTIAIQGSDTINSRSGTLTVPTQYGTGTARKITAGSPNAWHWRYDP